MQSSLGLRKTGRMELGCACSVFLFRLTDQVKVFLLSWRTVCNLQREARNPSGYPFIWRDHQE